MKLIKLKPNYSVKDRRLKHDKQKYRGVICMMNSEIMDTLKSYAIYMKKKGHSRQTQKEGMAVIFEVVLSEVYK